MIARMFLAAATALTGATGACSPAVLGRSRIVPVEYSEPKSDAITFWGHACAYIDVGGFGIVTDPVFSRKYATIRRRLISSPPGTAYDQTRIILISHAHQDHLDPPTLARFSPRTTILAPAPAARYLRKRGIKARSMWPGDEVPFPGGTIVAVTAHHPGYRLSLKARSDGRAIGYVIRTRNSTIYYTGDTEYFSGFAAVAARFRPDVTLLNLNAHLHSWDAFLAIQDLGAPTVVPMHLGAYDGKSKRLGPRWRAELIDRFGAQIVPLEVGESLSLDEVAREAGGRR
jgi:L-ascorbate metabolism protein UlaG (beta-lactamase superfamily)